MDGLGEHRKFAEKALTRKGAISGSRRAASYSHFTHNDYCLLPNHLTARTSFTVTQATIFWLICFLSIGGGIFHPQFTIMFFSIVFSVFYLTVVLFRAWVLADFGNNAPTSFLNSQPEPQERYVILSALYKERNMISDLIVSLDNLRWVKGKKNVYLVCEAGDTETIAAIDAKDLPDGFNLLIVPEGNLRTKPRALNFALGQVSGDYLVIYDAEDRPHRDQLLEAAAKFRCSDEKLVCLQAPLSIDNSTESFLTRLFAIEYATLFQGILPAIADMKAPMPLGGTSNHFKLAALKSAGGWDSYNVTEDADLGIRLAREGKHCGVIQLPTQEEAPVGFIPWTKQRTRWIKGWMQTLLVHLRHPAQTVKDMGWGNFLKLNMVLTSVVISVLVHPFFLAAFVFQMGNYFTSPSLNAYDISITALSAFNLVAGYTTYGLLAFAVLSQKTINPSRFWILALPIYWLMISIAGWRAVYQLIFTPFSWEKTGHGSAKRPPLDSA